MIDYENAGSLIIRNPNKADLSNWLVKINLSYLILAALEEGITDFLVALNSEIQILAAERVLFYKEDDNDIHLFVVKACDQDQEKWNKVQLKRCKRVLRDADGVYTVCNKPGKMTSRIVDEWMMGHASCVLPVFNGNLDDTVDILREAKKRDLDYIVQN